jgi:hypothetical protein
VKDSILLLICGLVAAGFSALFWRALGENGAILLLLISSVSLSADNWRLRRKLREQG